MPPIESICEAAGWWFSHPPTWTRRHIVTVKLKSDRDAHVQLDVEVELPRDEDASFPWNGRARLFVVPVAPITKELRPSHFELLDEHGGIAHTFTRADNARISASALERAATELLTSYENLDALLWLLNRLTVEVGREREFYLAWAEEELEAINPEIAESSAYRDFLDLARELYSGSMLWVPIVGLPGSQKTVRLSLHQKIEPAAILSHLWGRVRRTTTLVVAKADETERVRLREPARDLNTRGTLRRVWNRFADTLGFAPFQLQMPEPYLRRAASYHLQVESPAGVDVRIVRLISRVKWPRGAPGTVFKATASNRGHLYFSGAVGFDSPVAALIHFRVGRRGPLFLSALTATLIATMLWFFAANPEAAVERPEVAGPTLLLVPTLLIIFAARPGEHALVTRLLSGVRFLLLLCGVCSVAAASAIAGVLPFGSPHHESWKNVGYNWHYEAVIVTGVAAVLALSWLLAFHFLEVLRSGMRRVCRAPKRYLVISSMLFVGQLLFVLLVPGDGGRVTPLDAGIATALLAIAVLSGWMAAYGEETTRRGSSLLLALSSPMSSLAVPIFLGFNLGLVSWDGYHHALEIWLLGLFLTAFPYQFLRA